MEELKAGNKTINSNAEQHKNAWLKPRLRNQTGLCVLCRNKNGNTYVKNTQIDTHAVQKCQVSGFSLRKAGRFLFNLQCQTNVK